MSTDPGKVIDVRGVLEKNAYHTTVDELKSRGRDRVKVINARQISALIEESVARVLQNGGHLQEGGMPPQEVEKIVEQSRSEFRKLVQEREQELTKMRQEKADMGREREELEELRDRVAMMQSDLNHKQDDADRAGLRANELSSRIEEMQALVKVSQSESEQLRSRIKEIEGDGGGGGSAQTNEMMVGLMREVLELKRNMVEAPKPSENAEDAGKVMETMQSFADTVTDKLEKFGKKIGVSSAIEAQDVSFDNLFGDTPQLESNLENLQAKQRKGSSIQGALEKMRRMKQGGESEPEPESESEE